MAGQVAGRCITRPGSRTTRATWQAGFLRGVVSLKLVTATPGGGAPLGMKGEIYGEA